MTMIVRDWSKWPVVDQGRSLVYVTITPFLIVSNSNQAAAVDKRKKVKDKGLGRDGEDKGQGGHGEGWV